jgi:ABC-type dipeptide/oligopeptide/nickel transport system permease component
MTRYLARRCTALIPTVVGVVTLVFLMIHLLPGDPAAMIAGDNATQTTLDGIRVKLGLNQPLLQQYLRYWDHLLHGNLGASILTSIPVAKTLRDSLPITIVVSLSSVVLSTLIAVPLGTLAAYSRSRGNKVADYVLTGFSLAVDVMPGFWVAVVFILVFSLEFHWFPVSGPVPWHSPTLLLKRLALPVLVLGLGQIASVARVTRTTVLEVLGHDYVRTARALGTPEIALLFGHALRNAALPVVTITGLGIGRLLGGTVITERIFSLAGMGTSLINGINSRDYPIVQGMILFYAVLFIAVNVATDLAYTRIDPRVRLG